MVSEYLTRFYEPAALDLRRLSAESFGPTREIAAWVARVQEEWARVAVARVDAVTDTIAAGTEIDVAAEVVLGGLHPDEVDVHLAYGLLDGEGVLTAPSLTPLQHLGTASDGAERFGVHGVRGERSGRHGYVLRVTPRHPRLPIPFPLGLVRWSD
jgi:starch phosphorylase